MTFNSFDLIFKNAAFTSSNLISNLAPTKSNSFRFSSHYFENNTVIKDLNNVFLHLLDNFSKLGKLHLNYLFSIFN